eukprot:2953719-Ditylum_brightwellii.AAC.1
MADKKNAEMKEASTMLLSHLHTPNTPCTPFTASCLLTVCHGFNPHIRCQAFHFSHEQGIVVAAVTNMIKN